MKKYIKIVFYLLVISLALVAGWYLYVLFNFNLGSDKIELTEFRDGEASHYYSLNSFSGDATVSSNLQLRELVGGNEKVLQVLETRNYFQKLLEKRKENDTLYLLILLDPQSNVIDTFEISLGQTPSPRLKPLNLSQR